MVQEKAGKGLMQGKIMSSSNSDPMGTGDKKVKGLANHG